MSYFCWYRDQVDFFQHVENISLPPKVYLYVSSDGKNYDLLSIKETPYFPNNKHDAWEVIQEGEFQLAKSQQELWSASYKNGPEFEFCLQTVGANGSLYYNYVPVDYLGYSNPVYNGEWSSGYYVQRDHWLQTFDDWGDDRINWGIME